MTSLQSQLPPHAADGTGTYHAGVRPRDAATLVIVRREKNGPKLLMGTRHRKHRFMPEKVVFPGGRVDRCDYAPSLGSGMSPETTAMLLHEMRGRASERRAQAIALAAIRETYEETGILIGHTPPEPPRLPRNPGWQPFADHGVVPHLGALDLLARAITPPGLVRRFDTRFFIADASAITATTEPPTDELQSLGWLSPAEARDADIPIITRVMLDVVERYLEATANGDTAPAVPFFYMRHGRRIVEELAPQP